MKLNGILYSCTAWQQNVNRDKNIGRNIKVTTCPLKIVAQNRNINCSSASDVDIS